MQTSADFRANHQILSSRQILRDTHSGGKDILDVNNNGKADFHGRGRSVMVSYEEPALSDPMDNIAAFGARRDTEVVTDTMLDGRLKAQYVSRDSYSDSSRAWQTGGSAKLDDFAASFEPLEKDVHWGIDTKTHEFLMFKG